MAAFSDGTLADQLPSPYTLSDDHTLAVTLTQSQRIAWCAWAGTYWREVAIRDMVLPSLVVTPALPPGWNAVVATPSITWEPAYQHALTSMWHRPVTMVTGAAGTLRYPQFLLGMRLNWAWRLAFDDESAAPREACAYAASLGG